MFISRITSRPLAAAAFDCSVRDVAFGVNAGASPTSLLQLRGDLIRTGVIEARQIEQIAQHAQHLPTRTRLAHRRGRTRDGLPATFDVDVRARGFRERADRQHDIRVLRSGRIRRQRDDELRRFQRAQWPLSDARSSFGSIAPNKT